jgi:hypothetical protein
VTNAYPLITLGHWLTLSVCTCWYFGYQWRRTYTLDPEYILDLLIVPGLMVSVGIPTARWWRSRRTAR